MWLILAVKKVEISEVISTVLLIILLTLKKADLQDENIILSAASNFHSFSFLRMLIILLIIKPVINADFTIVSCCHSDFTNLGMFC